MSTKPLEQVRVATPCSVSWDTMKGDATVRFCSQCQLNVYNLSEMTRDKAEAFIAEQQGRVCVRLYRRPDGTVITRDCPVGRRALHRQITTIVSAIAAVLFLVASSVWASTRVSEQRKNQLATTWRDYSVVEFVKQWWQPDCGVVMGEMCITEPPPMPPVQTDQ